MFRPSRSPASQKGVPADRMIPSSRLHQALAHSWTDQQLVRSAEAIVAIAKSDPRDLALCKDPLTFVHTPPALSALYVTDWSEYGICPCVAITCHVCILYLAVLVSRPPIVVIRWRARERSTRRSCNASATVPHPVEQGWGDSMGAAPPSF